MWVGWFSGKVTTTVWLTIALLYYFDIFTKGGSENAVALINHLNSSSRYIYMLSDVGKLLTGDFNAKIASGHRLPWETWKIYHTP